MKKLFTLVLACVMSLAADGQARDKRRDADGNKDRGGGKAALQLHHDHRRRLAAGSPLRRLILPLLYHITSKGLRGASRLAKCLIRN